MTPTHSHTHTHTHTQTDTHAALYLRILSITKTIIQDLLLAKQYYTYVSSDTGFLSNFTLPREGRLGDNGMASTTVDLDDNEYERDEAGLPPLRLQLTRSFSQSLNSASVSRNFDPTKQ